MRFLIDENVPAAVLKFLSDRGHETIHALDLFLPGEKDEVLAVAADREEAIIVTWNLRDFRKITARRAPRGTRQQLRSLGWLAFKCKEPRGLDRITAVIDAVEFEYEQSTNKHDRRIFFEIHQDFFKVFR